MRAVIGLGNPGEKYAHTRHNAGFDTVSILAAAENIPIRKIKCQGLIGEGMIGEKKTMLVLPQTFMNESGVCVQELMHYFKLAPEDILIVYDDIDLPFGKVRVRPSGGAGTHNGMRSILYITETDRFPRIRIGMGGKPDGWDLADWVLSGFNDPESRKTAFDAYQKAAKAAKEFIINGIDLTMNKFNAD